MSQEGWGVPGTRGRAHTYTHTPTVSTGEPTAWESVQDVTAKPTEEGGATVWLGLWTVLVEISLVTPGPHTVPVG